ncbi:hypothetical protein SAMN05216289_1294 [Dokdonella immobilis]|uniref:Uncharacterized protein n=1 Tax=Dokdonella immobilis TaxID=578942 RepID=A0A1I4ZU89_9GAMM|nr:hypothetical protein SAMN05216289_1294 [Dokdonella immobilis]
MELMTKAMPKHQAKPTVKGKFAPLSDSHSTKSAISSIEQCQMDKAYQFARMATTGAREAEDRCERVR